LILLLPLNALFVVLIVRVGLLAAVVAFYVSGLFIFFPVTANPARMVRGSRCHSTAGARGARADWFHDRARWPVAAGRCRYPGVTTDLIHW
jgi:hypothetical protein